jgi:hypothetical protein
MKVARNFRSREDAMATVRELERLTDPTDEEFVDAVIHVHEGIRSRLKALSLGTVRPGIDDAVEDTDIIRSYCLSHGVDPRRFTETRRRGEPRWVAV